MGSRSSDHPQGSRNKGKRLRWSEPRNLGKKHPELKLGLLSRRCCKDAAGTLGTHRKGCVQRGHRFMRRRCFSASVVPLELRAPETGMQTSWWAGDCPEGAGTSEGIQ